MTIPINGTGGLPSHIYGAQASKGFVKDLAGELKRQRNQQNGISQPENEGLYTSLGIGYREPAPQKSDTSGMGDFMQLFLTQLKCQDPLKPKEGADFVAQLAQFNSVEQLQKVNGGIQDIADSFRSNRLLAATSMIGKQMNVPTDKLQLISHLEGTELKAEAVKGTIQLPRVGANEKIAECKVTITNDAGETVHGWQITTPQGGTEVPFTWSGVEKGKRAVDNSGQPIMDGNYKISAQALVQGSNGSRWVPVDTIIATKVNSVSVTKDGKIEFSAAGIGKLNIEELREISDDTPPPASPISAQTIAEALRDLAGDGVEEVVAGKG